MLQAKGLNYEGFKTAKNSTTNQILTDFDTIGVLSISWILFVLIQLKYKAIIISYAGGANE